MKSYAIYDEKNGDIDLISHSNIEPEQKYILVPRDTDADSFKVDLETLQLVPANRVPSNEDIERSNYIQLKRRAQELSVYEVLPDLIVDKSEYAQYKAELNNIANTGRAHKAGATVSKNILPNRPTWFI